MSFWDIAQTGATMVAGFYGGPAAAAAVGGGLSAARGKNVAAGAIGGYMSGLGSGSMAGAADATALGASSAGTQGGIAAGNIGQGIKAGAGITGTTGMSTFGGAGGFGTAAGQGIKTLPGAASTVPMDRFGSPLPSQPAQFGSVQGMKPGVDFADMGANQAFGEFPGGGGATTESIDKLGISTSKPSQFNEFNDFADKYNPSDNTGLQKTEIGPNFSNPNTNFAKGENYNYIDRSTIIPEGGFSAGERWDAVRNNPGEFLKHMGGGSKLYGAGKLGIMGAGLYSAGAKEDIEPGYKDNPMNSYDPNRSLSLNMDTGIDAALTKDSGLRLLAEGGYLDGGNVGDGMSDDIPARIDGEQEAALSEGEFVVPADVVSHLGNGSSNAGSKRLYAMMDQIRKARTGTEKQGKEINPERYMPT